MTNVSHLSDIDLINVISHEYQLRLRKNEYDDTDESMKISCMFLHMSDSLLLFIQSSRCGDAVAIERKCDWFVSVWPSLKQVEYVAAFHEKVDQLLVRFPTSQHVESQLSRTVRAYPRITGKSTIAHDEYIELGNCLLAMFPKNGLPQGND